MPCSPSWPLMPLGIPAEKIRLVTRDTDRTPDSSSASGSRVTYMSGGRPAPGYRGPEEGDVGDGGD